MSMYKVTVRDVATGSVKKTIMVRELPVDGEDLKIMIWLEPWE